VILFILLLGAEQCPHWVCAWFTSHRQTVVQSGRPECEDLGMVVGHYGFM